MTILHALDDMPRMHVLLYIPIGYYNVVSVLSDHIMYIIVAIFDQCTVG